MYDDELEFCNHEWGICPSSVDEDNGFFGEPHQCMWAPGHHFEHECGTCSATTPLTPDQTSNLEQPRASHS